MCFGFLPTRLFKPLWQRGNSPNYSPNCHKCSFDLDDFTVTPQWWWSPARWIHLSWFLTVSRNILFCLCLSVFMISRPLRSLQAQLYNKARPQSYMGARLKSQCQGHPGWGNVTLWILKCSETKKWRQFEQGFVAYIVKGDQQKVSGFCRGAVNHSIAIWSRSYCTLFWRYNSQLSRGTSP